MSNRQGFIGGLAREGRFRGTSANAKISSASFDPSLDRDLCRAFHPSPCPCPRGLLIGSTTRSSRHFLMARPPSTPELAGLFTNPARLSGGGVGSRAVLTRSAGLATERVGGDAIFSARLLRAMFILLRASTFDVERGQVDLGGQVASSVDCNSNALNRRVKRLTSTFTFPFERSSRVLARP